MSAPPALSNAETARRLKHYFWPQRWGMAASMLAFLLGSATEPLIPKLLQIALDEGFLAQPTFPLWSVPVALIGLFMLRGLFSFIGTYMLSRSTSRAVLDLRQELSASLLRADAAVFTRVTPGVAVAKVINDPQNIAGQLGGAMITLLRDGTTAIAMLTYLFWQNWQLTLLSMVTVPVLSVGVRAVHRRVQRVGGLAYEAQLRLVNVVDDMARAWRVIRTFDAGHFEHGRFEREAREVQRMTLKGAAASAMMTPVSQLAASFGVAAIVTMALYQAQTGTGSVGSFAGYVAALLLLVSKTRPLTDVSQPITGALITARGCFELLDAPAEPDQGTRSLARARGHVVFDAVQVAYPGAERPALDGLNLRIGAGQTVALVGSSGAGKTTVVNALLGFASPSAGHLTLDGIELAELRKADLRRQFAVVSQDIVLFDASIADNVVYAQPRDLTRVETCLRAAALWEHVASLPEGIEAPIGVNGSRLSGGQRQRLAIARALYKDAPIWILDEATSALDTESERAIQQALEQWHGQKTMIVIAHRLSTIRNADQIVVMENGRAVEAGRHAELIALGGRYDSMVRAQAHD
ncbi:MAG TPA: ABC transporter transmembrane domain-containing protein [Burkholderiaceae bacterium]|nr:ABC transporter transmembrane domain-containing protein [Burkholderiaceae bacterium]HMX09832.1 ABC transporter transmembrane domain-containing protein [Burkholderiaceae bacterium]HMY99123.1 ABC transporter transmembrane domain-containing protein [Burkholderiaceae bacterium]HNG80535.1 ABC transporter transmembrane domain-containing protein [Burkholderiaceae bacterium]